MTCTPHASCVCAMQVDTPAMARALELYYPLAQLMPDVPPTGYTTDSDPIMTRGHCAFGFRWTGEFSGIQALYAKAPTMHLNRPA